MSKKMFVVPEDMLTSLLRKTKITEDPLLLAQMETEKAKEKVLKKGGDSDGSLLALADLSQKGNILDEQRKEQALKPIPVKLETPIPTAPLKVIVKRRLATPIPAPKRVPRRAYLPKRTSILQRFYAYEPKMVAKQELQKMTEVPSTSRRLSTDVTKIPLMRSVEKAQSIDPALKDVPAPTTLTKKTRTGKTYGKGS